MKKEFLTWIMGTAVVLGLSATAFGGGHLASGFALFMLWLLWTGFIAASLSKQRRSAQIGEDLDPESRSLLSPIRRSQSDLQALVDNYKSSQTVQLLGKEALAETKRIVAQSAHNLEIRRGLVKSARGRHDAAKDVDVIHERITTAHSDEERASLESALNARTSELGHYEIVQHHIEKIDAGLRHAETAVSQIRANLLITASGEQISKISNSDLQDSLARLKAINMSVDEAEQLISGEIV